MGILQNLWRVALAAVLLSGCLDAEAQLRNRTGKTTASDCDAARCFFDNAPVQTLPQAVQIPGRRAVFHPTAKRLNFVDAAQGRWTAPRFTLTDGASIPRLFVPFVGDARTPSFRSAAALHDAYCGIGNELLAEYHSDSWQNVHRMFYDSLVAGGTPRLKAKVMFAAVWLGGPRWYLNRVPDKRLDPVPDEARIAAFLATKDFIERKDPAIPVLIDYLKWREVWMLAQIPVERSSGPPPEQPRAGNNGDGSGIGPIGGSGGASCANMNDPACTAGGL